MISFFERDLSSNILLVAVKKLWVLSFLSFFTFFSCFYFYTLIKDNENFIYC